jgi:tungstate transport system ATP-binding protein
MIFPLQLSHLNFERGRHRIIDDVSLDITGGNRTIILGANGAGKSVLMRLAHGLLPPTNGRVSWNGLDHRPKAQAMVFQRPVMLRRSLLDNVAYGLAMSGVARKARIERGRAALARVGLSHLSDRHARVLSGGEQQRAAIARAWALDPEVLFLDEPTASLDPSATWEIEEIIREIGASGTKIIMSTHNLGQAKRLADEIVFLHQGRVAEQTPAEEFFRQPRSAPAAEFIKGELPWV